MKLYEAVEALAQVNAWIEENGETIAAAGGELPRELEELLDQAEGDLDTKVTRVGFMIRQLEAEGKASREEAAFFQARAQARENSAKALKAYVLYQLTKAGLTKAGTERLQLRRQGNSAPSAAVVDAGRATEYCRVRFLENPGALHWRLLVSAMPEELRCELPAVEYELDGAAAKKLREEVGLELEPGETKEVAGVRFTRGEHVRFA